MKYIAPEKLHEFGKTLLMAYGTSEKNATIISDHLVENALIGLENQGAMRFYEYVNFMDKGTLDGGVKPEVSEKANGVLLVDGKGGIGVVACEMAVEAMKKKLKEQPVVFAGIVNVGHTGRIGAYAQELANDYCFGMVMGGGAFKQYSTVAPFGGKKGVISTNPLAMAMPGKDGIPVCADFATSATAGGFIRMAIRKGLTLPDGFLITEEGKPTNDPKKFKHGAYMLPAAGTKGYGLALIIEMLCYAMLGEPLEFNWIMMAARLDTLCPKEEYEVRAKEYLDYLNACPPLDGFKKVVYPGQYEAENKKNCLESGRGLGLNENVIDSLIEMAKKKAVTLPKEFLT